MGFFDGVANFFGIGGATSAPAPPTKPNGSDGVFAFGGFVQSGERSAALQGRAKYRTFANDTNSPVIATGRRIFADLIGSGKWHCEPNERGGKDAQRGVDIVTEGLLKARMPRPWSAVARRATAYKFEGNFCHEWTLKQRPDDGQWVCASLDPRPPDTIEQWIKPEREELQAIVQLTQSGNRYTIPRERLLYCFDDTLSSSPDGVGLLRHTTELIRKLRVFEEIEGFSVETDLRGIPMASAPIAELKIAAQQAGCAAGSKEEAAFVKEKTAFLTNFMQGALKDPSKMQWLLMPSELYKGADPDVLSAAKKWMFELLRGDPKGLAELDTIIRREELRAARVLGIEFVMIGADGSGTYGSHVDKTNMFGVRVQGTGGEIGQFATNDIARVLVAFNGLDADTCTPTVVMDPISTDAIESVTRALANLALAGLAPGDPARNVLRERMSLPPEPPPTPGMLGILQRPAKPGPPDPALGEQDVDLDELGQQPTMKRRRKSA